MKKSGGTFCVDDGEGDVTVRVGVKKLNQVLTFLGKCNGSAGMRGM